MKAKPIERGELVQRVFVPPNDRKLEEIRTRMNARLSRKRVDERK